jgi:two-component system sensor histidine kinase/response regulator
MQQQRKQLELTTSFEKKIFSIIGHDLRSPMGNIRTYIDAFLMVNNALDEGVVNLLKDLYLLSDNAFNLLENLLNWAKSQSGGIVCRPQMENISYVTKNVMALFSLQAESKKINLTYEGKDVVEGFFDPELISVVVRNLVSNALKFTPHGGSVKIIAKHATENNNERLLISVADTGTGMSPEIVDNLVNKNIHYTTYGTDNEKGSGLGFQLCKEFVALNNGYIWIESLPSSGSTFNVSLPRRELQIQ